MEDDYGEDEDEYDDNDRADIQKMELALLLEKIRADLGGQEGAVPEDEELASLMKEVGALLAEQEEDQYDEYDDDESAAIIAMEMAALMEEARVNLAEGEEAAGEDEDDYDDEEDETIVKDLYEELSNLKIQTI